MLEYIYFVKCPGCEDEHFDFFNEAKDFAMSLLSKKPIITQIEVDRNDFGECVDSCDLGTVWSWEDMMDDMSAESETVFNKADTLGCDCDGKCGSSCKCRHHNEDPEFAALDNSLEAIAEEFVVGSKVFCKANKKTGTVKSIKGDLFEVEFTGGSAPDRIDTYYKQDLKLAEARKPIPVDMSIKDLVEAMEENEDTVECAGCEELFHKEDCFYKEGIGWLCSDCEDSVVRCTWCEELFDKSDCKYEVDMGWLCRSCQAGIMSRGEQLTFRENTYWDFLDESFNPNEKVEFDYDNLKVTLQGSKRDVDDWDEAEDEVSYTFTKKKDDVATDIWENFIQEADVKDIEGGLEALEDDSAWNGFLAKHFDELLDKYYDKLLKYYEDAACKEYEETHSLDEAKDPHDLVELEYPSLTATLYGSKRDADDWDEVEHTDSHVFLVPKVEVATAIWENWITEDDVKDVEGGLAALEDDNAWEAFLETHFDDLFEKYNKQILDHFEDEAIEDFRERSQEEYSLNNWQDDFDSAYDTWRDDHYFGESKEKQKPFLEEFDDAETRKANMTDCPECGAVTYDMKEQYCSNCGLGL